MSSAWKLGPRPWIVASRHSANGGAGASLLEKSTGEGESPVRHLQPAVYGVPSKSHVPRAWSAKGGKFHLKLNIGSRPIANKYHEGKMKRTLERELKVPEIAEREANGTSVSWRDCCALR